ncbi:uncharacterized protein LOC126667493 [Mercurialis annua]|uniref:uncharacterized protein LOC126667493 n=1 Tax=Mercurialis annua TaxID=3986 RepID=UPI00215E8D74|nr:uncharacterized protein LOC126667493 [Mercurialis annua]
MEDGSSSSTAITESRDELMISSADHQTPTLRKAHFLKPSKSTDLQENFSLCSDSLPVTFNPQNWPLTVHFHGWKFPQKEWREWVQKMASLHEPTWKKAGIHEAIVNSTYQIHRNDLVLGVAERWCPQTNSFIFPWGEATLTLEDMMVYGYSVLGLPVFKSLETVELREIEQKLNETRLEFGRTSAKKATHYLWLKRFMDNGEELEHEAFLSLWLSRFVLPISHDVISERIFPIAIHLARGVRIALAPAVLANIYSDLTLLKGKIVSLSSLVGNTGNDVNYDKSIVGVTVFSPLQLVQVWIWERFLKLRPNPKYIENGEPRLAQWNNLRCKFENLRLVLDSSKESFVWRPYTKPVKNWEFPKFYREEEMWVSVNSCLDEELESFFRCLRVSELVGIGADCIEQYLPHRVARQFGFDQDVPAFVARSSENREDAWNVYNRPLTDVKCYVPSRLFETDVTVKYMEWWKDSVLERHKSLACLRKELKQSREKNKRCKLVCISKIMRKSLKPKKAENDLRALNAPLQSPNSENIISCLKRSSKILKRKNMDSVVLDSSNYSGRKSKTLVKSLDKKTLVEINDLPFPPGFPPKCKRLEAGDSSEEDHLTIAQLRKSRNKHEVKTWQAPLSEAVENKEGDNENASGRNLIPDTVVEHNEAAVQDGHGSNGKIVSGRPYVNDSSPGDNAVQLTLKSNEPAETKHDNDGGNVSGQLGQPLSRSSSTGENVAIEVLDMSDGENAGSALGQSQSPSSSVAGSKTVNNSEPREVSVHTNESGEEGNPFETLEGRISMLEKVVADRKAILFMTLYGECEPSL